MSVSLTAPLWLVLLVPLALASWWSWRGGRGLSVPRGPQAAVPRGTAGLLARVPLVLRVVAMLALLAALARPRSPGEVVEERSGPGIPIVVAIDVSSSMLAQDFPPRDRLDVARGATLRFIRERANDPVGLVAFAAEALTLVPVTTYRPVLESALGSLRVGLLEDGTAIGDGLATAVNRVRRMAAEDRVVVLLSDGESNRGRVDPRQAAAAAAEVGVRVYTVGIGTDGVARVPVQRASAGLAYAELPVGLDEELLREIAHRTGGEYFRATSPESLTGVFASIDALVPTTVEVRRHQRYREWYPLLLGLAALALLLEWVLRASRWGAVP